MGSPSRTIASSWRPAASDDQSTAYWPSPTSLTPARSFWPPAPSRDASPPPAQALPWRSRMTTMARAVVPAAARGGFDDARRTVHIWRSGGAATTSKVTGDPGRSSPDVLRAMRRRYAPARQTVSAPPRRLASRCEPVATRIRRSPSRSGSPAAPRIVLRVVVAPRARSAPAARRERHQLGDELLVGGRRAAKRVAQLDEERRRLSRHARAHRVGVERAPRRVGAQLRAHAPRAAADRLAVQRHRHGVRARARDAVRHRVRAVAVVADRARRRRRPADGGDKGLAAGRGARGVAGIDGKVGGASDERLGEAVAVRGGGGGGGRRLIRHVNFCQPSPELFTAPPQVLGVDRGGSRFWRLGRSCRLG